MTSAPGSPPADAMAAEFDTVAAWTEQAVLALGLDHAVAAGCRGSGSPAALDWLGGQLRLQRGSRLLDAGAGVGGPAAYAAGRWGVQPLLVDPMPGACRAGRRLFGLPAAVAWSQQLPVAESSVPAAWCLGVLSTTTEKAALLHELRRVLADGGRLGLLVLVRGPDPLPESPEGNSFPTEDELGRLLGQAAFAVRATVDAADLPPPPADWQARADRVEQRLAADHGDDPAWQVAARQGEVLGRLLRDGHLRTLLVSAVVA